MKTKPPKQLSQIPFIELDTFIDSTRQIAQNPSVGQDAKMYRELLHLTLVVRHELKLLYQSVLESQNNTTDFTDQ